MAAQIPEDWSPGDVLMVNDATNAPGLMMNTLVRISALNLRYQRVELVAVDGSWNPGRFLKPTAAQFESLGAVLDEVETPTEKITIRRTPNRILVHLVLQRGSAKIEWTEVAFSNTIDQALTTARKAATAALEIAEV